MVQVFPNPASEQANISFKSDTDETFMISLMEINGKLISKEKIEAKSGFNILPFDISNLPKGMYFVQLAGNGKTTLKKLAIQ